MQTELIRATLALAVASSATFAQEGGPRPIRLDEAVRLAQRNAPAATEARNALRVSRMQVMSALGQFLPSLGASAGASKSQGAIFFQGRLEPYTGNPWNYSKGYGLGVTVFDGGQRWFTYRAAQASLRAGTENDVLQRFNVSLSVKQQYYAVLAARETEAAAERALEQAQAQLTMTSARVRAGAAIHTDSLRSAILVGTARLAILNARNALRTANAALTRLVGSPNEVTAIASDTSEVPRIETDSTALERLADEGPGVRAAAATHDAARASRRASLTSYLPFVTARYGYSTSRSSPTFDWGGGPPASKSTGYGFSLSFTVFNNLSRELGVMTATVAEENAQARLRDARLAAREILAQYLGAFRTAEQTIELQRLQIAAAEADQRAQQSRYALGSASLLDLLTSQTALDNARVALINARFQARTAKAQLEAFVGRELR